MAALTDALNGVRKREYMPLADDVYASIAAAIDRISFDLATLGINNAPRFVRAPRENILCRVACRRSNGPPGPARAARAIGLAGI